MILDLTNYPFKTVTQPKVHTQLPPLYVLAFQCDKCEAEGNVYQRHRMKVIVIVTLCVMKYLPAFLMVVVLA